MLSESERVEVRIRPQSAELPLNQSISIVAVAQARGVVADTKLSARKMLTRMARLRGMLTP